MSSIEKAAKIISSAQKGVAFTGAGISAASGISTYRDSGGLWDRYGSQGMLNVLAKHPDKAHEILEVSSLPWKNPGRIRRTWPWPSSKKWATLRPSLPRMWIIFTVKPEANPFTNCMETCSGFAA